MSGSLLRTGGRVCRFALGSACERDADRVRPGCCLVTSCFRSNSDWNSSKASVSFFASASRVVYVSSHVPVRCLVNCVEGEVSLRDTFGDDVLEDPRDNEGAGEVLVDEAPPTLSAGDA